ncbi:hypothetical protein ACFQ0K_09645 [Nocardioides caeni]|uniref:WD40 repeat domain-containing protein n=1 Tax=Nocardioides caeni TaxID=574700 RepID=A0A4S8N5W1_9ACTN|nr:hypothetical protein [Nocardioides caeni]THV11255.1 hypothetical protein E9934_13305 [Nocardioides caeni]
MHRATIASLAVAAVLGTSGGIALAVSSVDDSPSAGERPSGAASSTGDPSGSGDPAGKDAPVFYYADGAIHDGDRSVAVPTDVASGQVAALQRVRDGWLVVNVSDDGETYIGTYVSIDDAPWRISQWRGTWDLSVERDRVVFSDGLAWRVAVFEDRATQVLDVIDGVGEELAFMDRSLPLPGIAISTRGVITGWDIEDGPQLVDTETDHWTHEELGRRGLEVPLTSPDGSQVVASYLNPDYAPDNPVGDCLTGGETAAADAWWDECGIGPASRDPWSPDGTGLLIMGTSNDGPGSSWLRVVDPVSGEVAHEFDPGGLLVGAEWVDDGTVDTLSYLNDEASPTLQRCDVATEACTIVTRLDGNVVLGSA